MSRKIIGITVGTTINPKIIGEKIDVESSLPTVTEEDNGKVLKVQGGQWLAEENDAEKFGGQLPDHYAKKTELPSKLSELENDTGYLTEHQSLEAYAKKEELPIVPTKVSAFENDKGYLTEHQSLDDYAKKEEIPAIPDKVSAFENDKGYLTEHQSLDNYYTKTETADALNKKQDVLLKYVESVNGYSGEVKLSASDVKALPDTTVIPTIPNVVSAFTNDADYADRKYVAEIAAGKCNAYTFGTVAELDEWLSSVENIANLNNGDVFYIREVGVPDYWWDRETQSKQILETTKVDLTDYARKENIPLNVSQLENDAKYITASEADAKLGEKQDKLTEYVSSVNGKSGKVSLNSSDVGALPFDTFIPDKVSQLENDKGYLTEHQDLSAYAKKSEIPTVPAKVSSFENDVGYAKKTEIPTVPTALSQLSQDTTHRVVTDAEKSAWNAKSNFSGKYADLTGKPIADGKLTAPLKVTGGDSSSAGKLILDENNAGQITNDGTSTLFGFLNTTDLSVGSSSFNLKLRGKGTRPKFNDNNMALYSDIPSSLPANGGNADTVDGKHIVVSSSTPTSNDTTKITFVV